MPNSWPGKSRQMRVMPEISMTTLLLFAVTATTPRFTPCAGALAGVMETSSHALAAEYKMMTPGVVTRETQSLILADAMFVLGTWKVSCCDENERYERNPPPTCSIGPLPSALTDPTVASIQTGISVASAVET